MKYERTWKIINNARAAAVQAKYELVRDEIGDMDLNAFSVDPTAPEGSGDTLAQFTFRLTYATSLKEAGIRRADIEGWDAKGMRFGFPVADFIDELLKIDAEESADRSSPEAGAEAASSAPR